MNQSKVQNMQGNNCIGDWGLETYIVTSSLGDFIHDKLEDQIRKQLHQKTA